MKTIRIILLFFFIEFSLAINYDEEFSQGLKNFYSTSTITQKTYKLTGAYNYYEIINYNTNLTFYRGDEELIKLKGLIEESFFFQKESNYDYFIKVELELPHTYAGVYLQGGNNALDILSLSGSSLAIRFAERREASLKIINKESTPQIIFVQLDLNSESNVSSAKLEENGVESVFPCVVANHDNPNSHYVKYYALLTNEILFKPLLYYPSSNTQNFHYGSARLNYLTYTSITDNIVQCPGKGNNVLGYKLTSPANKPYYEISIKANSLIYNMKNNFEANKITSINRYSNDYAYLLADTNKNIACFSIIFSDEKNSIIEDSDLKIVLFDTRDYNATFAGSKKYIQIIYKKNDYFNLTLFLLNENVEIKFRYYDFKNMQYFYSFEKTSDELQVQFHFEKVKEFSSNMNYYQIEMSYKGLDEDIAIETIDKNTFKCLNEYTIFNIKYNTDKSYIYLLTNDTNIY